MCRITENYGLGEDRRSGSVQKPELEEMGGVQSPVITEISTRAVLRAEFLTVQGNFSRIIVVVRRNLCFLSVYMGNPSSYF